MASDIRKSPRAARGRKDIQAIVNNFKSVPADRYGAARAKFILGELRKRTGRTEQSLLIHYFLSGVEQDTDMEVMLSEINREYDRSLKYGSRGKSHK